jgi:hypothetical protein
MYCQEIFSTVIKSIADLIIIFSISLVFIQSTIYLLRDSSNSSNLQILASQKETLL